VFSEICSALAEIHIATTSTTMAPPPIKHTYAHTYTLARAHEDHVFARLQTLIEVGAPHEVKVLDHSAFPDSFGTLYKGAIGADPESDGSVPVIVEDDFVLAESSVIAAFLATKYGSSAEGTALAPSALSAEDHARRQIFLEQVIPKVRDCVGGD
jgi:hypothetical protein